VSDETSGYPGAPPGWYADPAGGPGQRWWDGYAWTDTVVLPAPPPPPPPGAGFPHQAPAQPAYQQPASQQPISGPPVYQAYSVGLNQASANALFEEEQARFGIGRVAFAVPAIAQLLDLIIVQSQRSAWRTLGHDFHRIWIAAQNNQPTPTFNNPPAIDPLILVVGLLSGLALIFALIWQHRAASVARALGLPARHSPGWGVGSWFVPVVSLWMPYQAIRDCLPPDDPKRSLILRWWLLNLATGYVTAAAFVSAAVSEKAGTIVAIPAALMALALLATAPRVVTAVTSAHRTMLGRAPA
jgi:hypothetical protein